jgi:hypothetical protein
MPPRDPEAADAALMAAGKALYLANAFESKCRFVLRVANLESFLETHPGAGLDDAIASLAREKLLYPTIEELKSFPIVKEDEADVLDKARDARNFIAHEGAGFGDVFSTTESHVREHFHRLRKAVVDLARGDNIVSRWVYEIEEKEPAPLSMLLSYPTLVEEWVFGDLQCP